MRRLVLGLVAVVVLATCTQPTDGRSDRTARVERLLADLEGDDAAAETAAAALAALGPADAAAIPTLMAALSCPTEPAAHDDAGEPHAHGDHAHTECNDHIVLAAASGLGAIGGAAVAPLLARIRANQEPNHTFASYALGRMHPNAAPALLPALDDPEPRVRLAIVAAIRGMQPPPAGALPAIAARLGDADADVRIQAADALGHFGPAALAPLASAFDDPEPRVRASAASAFRFIGPPARDAAPVLRAHLGDPAAPVRLNAIAALAAIGADDAATVGMLAAALADPDHTVRWGAAMALGRLGPAAAGARAALEKTRADVHPLVRAAADDALGKLSGHRP